MNHVQKNSVEVVRGLVESKEQLITRLLAKADLDFKCCGFAPPTPASHK
ncbi:MAG: hypothetical protein ABI461_23180 [Polyangiaceae bacterium]